MYVVQIMKPLLLFCIYFFMLSLLSLFDDLFFEKQPHPSAALLRTPKHLGPLNALAPLVLLYSFSADACIIYTVYSIFKTGQNCIKTLSLMLLQQL